MSHAISFRRTRQLALASALLVAAGGSAFAHGPGHGYRGAHGGHGAGIERVIAHVQEKLALDTSQQVMFDSALAATKSAREAGRAQREAMKEALRAELNVVEPDLAKLAAMADAARDQHQAVHRQVRDQWLALYQTFSATQKAVVREALATRLERHERFNQRMRERFGS